MRSPEKAIDGVLYTTTTLPATEGLHVLAGLMRIFGGEVLSLIVAADPEQRATLFQEPKIIGPVIGSIARNATQDGALDVIRDVLKSTTADKISVGDAEVPGSVYERFDTHFAGRYAHLAQVVIWVATVNFMEP